MKLSRRVAWLLLVLGVVLFLGVLFRAFIIANVVIPTGILLMLLWRLVLSVHQAIYWGAVIALAMGLVIYHLARLIGRAEELPSAPGSDSILSKVNYWRSLLETGGEEGISFISVKSDLRGMLIATYAATLSGAAPFTIHEALRLRQLPLPGSLYNFLFAEEAKAEQLSWKRRLWQLAAKPDKRFHRWTARDRAEFYQAVEETLTFLEKMQEIKHGNDYFDSPIH